MVRRFIAITAFIALASANSAQANKWLDESIGDGNFVWVEKDSRSRTVARGKSQFKKLKDGTYYSEMVFKLRKPQTYVAKVWYRRDGTLKLADYENGRLYGRGSGTWRMEGSKMIHFSTFKTADGQVTYSGHSRRINRNKWVTSMTMNPGNVKITVTDTATKKSINNFFKGLVGRWKFVNETTVADDYNSTFRHEGVMTIRLLKSGVLYSETKGVIEGKRSLAKAWKYPRGTFRGVAYLGGKKIDEGKGKWWIRKGKLFTNTRSEYGKSDGVMRRISPNKYVEKGTHSDGSRSTSTLTRLRK